jgi:hypothetical protein
VVDVAAVTTGLLQYVQVKVLYDFGEAANEFYLVLKVRLGLLDVCQQ